MTSTREIVEKERAGGRGRRIDGEVLVNDARCGRTKNRFHVYTPETSPCRHGGGYVCLNLEGYLVQFDRLFSSLSSYRGERGGGRDDDIDPRA